MKNDSCLEKRNNLRLLDLLAQSCESHFKSVLIAVSVVDVGLELLGLACLSQLTRPLAKGERRGITYAFLNFIPKAGVKSSSFALQTIILNIFLSQLGDLCPQSPQQAVFLVDYVLGRLVVLFTGVTTG